jgi:hypothetical protein
MQPNVEVTSTADVEIRMGELSFTATDEKFYGNIFLRISLRFS